MVVVFNTRRGVSALRRGILFLLALSITVTLFGTALAAPADAASYKVKDWSGGTTYNYYVYQGSLPQYYEPTFYRTNSDVYTSGNMKISFYIPWDNADAGKADAFSRYQVNKAGNSVTAGWYSIDSICYVYKIDGWNSVRDSLDKLLSKSSFINPNGQTLYLTYIGRGNLVSSKWWEITQFYDCSSAVYIPDVDATIGFRFVDPDGYSTMAYTPG